MSAAHRLNHHIGPFTTRQRGYGGRGIRCARMHRLPRSGTLRQLQLGFIHVHCNDARPTKCCGRHRPSPTMPHPITSTVSLQDASERRAGNHFMASENRTAKSN